MPSSVVSLLVFVVMLRIVFGFLKRYIEVFPSLIGSVGCGFSTIRVIQAVLVLFATAVLLELARASVLSARRRIWHGCYAAFAVGMLVYAVYGLRAGEKQTDALAKQLGPVAVHRFDGIALPSTEQWGRDASFESVLDSVWVTVTTDALRFGSENTPTAALSDGRISGTVEKWADAVRRRLVSEGRRLKRTAAPHSGEFVKYSLVPPEVSRPFAWPKEKGVSLILAIDKNVPFSTVRTVLRAAGAGGFGEWYLRIARNEFTGLRPYIALPRFFQTDVNPPPDDASLPGVELRVSTQGVAVRSDGRFTADGKPGAPFVESVIPYEDTSYPDGVRDRLGALKAEKREETECLISVEDDVPLRRLVEVLMAGRGSLSDMLFPDQYFGSVPLSGEGDR